MRLTVVLASVGAVLALAACKPAEEAAPKAVEPEVVAETKEPAYVMGPTSAETDYVGPGALRMKLGLTRGDFSELFPPNSGAKLMPTIKVENGWAYGPAQVAGQDLIALWKQDGDNWPVVALTYGDTKGDFRKFCSQVPAGLVPVCA